MTLGTNTAFSCSAAGPGDILYHWNRTEIGANGALVEIGFYNVSRVSGEDTPTLMISNVGVRDEGSYTCFVSINGSSVGDITAVLDTRGESILEALEDEREKWLSSTVITTVLFHTTLAE